MTVSARREFSVGDAVQVSDLGVRHGIRPGSGVVVGFGRGLDTPFVRVVRDGNRRTTIDRFSARLWELVPATGRGDPGPEDVGSLA